ncbi:MAG: (d)CMP kinase [Epsilonproteobacteria bacterium]|nr:(d)CMP kinase [Campylobacterota bacterium]
MIITIDGPAGSGKSSVARALAKKLGYYHLSTGLLYRTLAYILILQKGTICCQKFLRKPELINEKDLDFVSEITYKYDDQGIHILFQDRDITHRIRDVSLENLVSYLSTFKFVRQKLLDFQRSLADHYNLVADGRDCGTVVFPDADVKFFLTADFDTRLDRVCSDSNRKSIHMEREQVAQDLKERDQRDSTRDESPLKIPDGAIVIDNTNLNQEETVGRFLTEIEKHQ